MKRVHTNKMSISGTQAEVTRDAARSLHPREFVSTIPNGTSLPFDKKVSRLKVKFQFRVSMLSNEAT